MRLPRRAARSRKEETAFAVKVLDFLSTFDRFSSFKLLIEGFGRIHR